ncbi:MAG: hypothetical protein WKF37_25350, partial [Bryobacteraceae bacterium]
FYRYNRRVNRRLFGLLLAGLLKAEGQSIRGKLSRSPEDKPALTVAGRLILLDGDEDTLGVLNDKRLLAADMELNGTLEGSKFTVNPIHMRSMFVHKGGERLSISYWCDVCAIRTYTPGLCWCCREDTILDLRKASTPA